MKKLRVIEMIKDFRHLGVASIIVGDVFYAVKVTFSL
jgi:hypothetical protein